MEFTWEQLALVASVVAVSSALQSAAGFGAGLYGISLLQAFGWPLPAAIIVNLVTSLVQSGLGAWQLRREIPWRPAAQATVLRVAALPVGLWALARTDSLARDNVVRLVGVVLLVIVAVQWGWKVEPRERIATFWTWAALLGSGFMAGFCGMGGPLLVLWAIAHQWTSEQIRGLLFATFAVTLWPQVGLMYAQYGAELHVPIALGLASVPAMAAGALVGLRIGSAWSTATLRFVNRVLLVLLGLRAVFS